MSEVTPNFKVARVRSRRHLDWIATLPCSVPGCLPRHRETVVPHHLTCSPEPKARGLKSGDNWTLPLCAAVHHGPGIAGSLHDAGDERAWWARHGLDPIAICERLAAVSRAMGLLP